MTVGVDLPAPFYNGHTKREGDIGEVMSRTKTRVLVRLTRTELEELLAHANRYDRWFTTDDGVTENFLRCAAAAAKRLRQVRAEHFTGRNDWE